jgi:hypothetical protein
MSTIRRETLETVIGTYFFHPVSASRGNWNLLSFLREDSRASIYLSCTRVCLVCRVKLFSKDILHRKKKLFTILWKSGLGHSVSVCVFDVSSSRPVFYSDSKIKYFPKNTSSRGTRFRCEYSRVSDSPVSFLTICESVQKYKNLKHVARHYMGKFSIFVIFLSNTAVWEKQGWTVWIGKTTANCSSMLLACVHCNSPVTVFIDGLCFLLRWNREVSSRVAKKHKYFNCNSSSNWG